MKYVYANTEPGVFTVGYYDPAGKWNPDTDYNTRAEAGARAAFLNGSSAPMTEEIKNKILAILDSLPGAPPDPVKDPVTVRTRRKTWEERVEDLEEEGCTRSDAQGIADVELGQGKLGYPHPDETIDHLCRVLKNCLTDKGAFAFRNGEFAAAECRLMEINRIATDAVRLTQGPGCLLI